MPQIHRRTVWYFHGFDPAPPARYRRIFDAASAHFERDICELDDGAEGWSVTREGVTSDIRYLRYEPLVRAFRAGSAYVNAARGLAAIVGYAFSGALWRIARLAPRTFVLALTPALVIGVICLGLTLILSPATVRTWAPELIAPVWVAGMILGGLALGIWITRWMFVDVIGDLFAFMQVLARGHGPVCVAYDEGLAAARTRIVEAGHTDETLIVGHSLGGIAALLTAADLLDDWPEEQPLHLLTLGSTHGIVLAQRGPGRDRLASAIRRVCTDARVFWVDVSSPRDAFTIPLTDPLSLIERPAGTSPRVISAQLAGAPTIPGDRRTVFAAMRRHMGYLLAAPPGAGFDYVDTVTGTPSLRDRFGLRGNSPKARMWHG